MAWLWVPLCALSVAVDLDDGGVDHGVFHVRSVRTGLEKPDENPGFDPVAVTLENSVPVAEERRKIWPRASRPHDPKYRFDEAAVRFRCARGPSAYPDNDAPSSPIGRPSANRSIQSFNHNQASDGILILNRLTSCRAATIETDALSPIDCAQLGFEARSGARVSSNVNGTTACTSHVCGKTGARQIIEGSTECGAYSWAICGWTSNSGLGLTVASSAIAAEAKMNIDPAARANCKDFRITFLRRFLVTHRRIDYGASS